MARGARVGRVPQAEPRPAQLQAQCLLGGSCSPSPASSGSLPWWPPEGSISWSLWDRTLSALCSSPENAQCQCSDACWNLLKLPISAAPPSPGSKLWGLAPPWVKDRAALYYVQMYLFAALGKTPVFAIWHVTQPPCPYRFSSAFPPVALAIRGWVSAFSQASLVTGCGSPNTGYVKSEHQLKVRVLCAWPRSTPPPPAASRKGLSHLTEETRAQSPSKQHSPRAQAAVFVAWSRCHLSQAENLVCSGKEFYFPDFGDY